jgi:hypothetical protein
MAVSPPRAEPRSLELDVDPNRALDVLAVAAEAWGAEWLRHGTGGRLGVPVSGGLRRGWIEGTVRTERRAGGSILRFETETESYRLQVAAVFVLGIGAASGLFLMVAPLLGEALGLAPVAVVLLLAAWFMVLARLRNRSFDDFQDLFVGMLEAGVEVPAGGSAGGGGESEDGTESAER